jgi:hypothetical protein
VGGAKGWKALTLSQAIRPRRSRNQKVHHEGRSPREIDSVVVAAYAVRFHGISRGEKHEVENIERVNLRVFRVLRGEIGFDYQAAKGSEPSSVKW